jgi:hypothetical protein
MLLSIKKLAEADLEDDVFEDSFGGVWSQMEQVFEAAKKLRPITEPAQPDPNAERDLILKEILRSQVDLQTKVNAVLNAQTADARRIIRSVTVRQGERSNLTQKDLEAMQEMLLEIMNKEQQKHKVPDKRSRESLPREVVDRPDDGPPDDDVPFYDGPPDDDVPF